MTAASVRRVLRQPRRGDVIAGRTGDETVVAVHDHGRRLVVRDRLDRLWTRDRADDGWWTLVERAT